MNTNNTREFNQKIRPRVLERDEYTCQTCGLVDETGKELHIDHIIPQSRGGTDDMDNLQVLCRFHNQSKHAKMPGERIEYFNPLYAEYLK